MGAFAIYFNHRFVLHGKLGKLPVLRKTMIMHGLHHAHSYTDDCLDYINIPVWGWITLLSLTGLLTYLSLPMGLGLLSCWVYYEIMHRYIHFQGKDGSFGVHHRLHHEKPNINFSGVHPWIDRIFNTTGHE
jgi:sterol desaturase/sphingolipid hydroxylase (fatty acid hydroxylase superfamily)